MNPKVALQVPCNKVWVDNTIWEKLQKFDKIIQVTHEYRRLLQQFQLEKIDICLI